jgi:formylglycine-generating enzyme required for sulfatase activity
VRLANLAVAGSADRAPTGRDRRLVGELLLDLLVRGAPGATRTRTLLNLMADRSGTAVSWSQVWHTARKLEEDLSEGAGMASQLITSGPVADGPLRRRGLNALAVLLILLAVLAALAVGALLRNHRRSPPRARDLAAMVEIPAGRFLTHDGNSVALERFWIDAHEVSIAEYAAFLEVLAALPEGKRGGYDHADQPVIKLDHIPDDWEAMWTAARSGGTLEGLSLDLNFPITRIDWWDAYAYANWKGARLPTQEEWLASSQDGEVRSTERGAVDRLGGDVTPRGIYGLAGNVSEWVRDPAKNPAFPMNPKQSLSCGGSYLHPRNGVRTRVWHPSRETRRSDLGFRTVRDAAP